MKLVITYPSPTGGLYLWQARMLESYAWLNNCSIGKIELSWNEFYNFWDLKCLEISEHQHKLDKLTALLQSLDLERFEAMPFNCPSSKKLSMRYFLYPKKDHELS